MIKTVILTIIYYWIISLIVCTLCETLWQHSRIKSEDIAMILACGLTLPIAFVLCYPIRVFNEYKAQEVLLRQRGYSYWKYLFGGRRKIKNEQRLRLEKEN